jgi:hypothetical protein
MRPETDSRRGVNPRTELFLVHIVAALHHQRQYPSTAKVQEIIYAGN